MGVRGTLIQLEAPREAAPPAVEGVVWRWWRLVKDFSPQNRLVRPG